MPLTAVGKPERKGSAWKDGTDAGLLIFGSQRRANMPLVSEIFVSDSSYNGKVLSGEPRTRDGLSVFTLLKTRAPVSKKLVGAGRKPREKPKKIRNEGRWSFYHVPGIS